MKSVDNSVNLNAKNNSFKKIFTCEEKIYTEFPVNNVVVQLARRFLVKKQVKYIE